MRSQQVECLRVSLGQAESLHRLTLKTGHVHFVLKYDGHIVGQDCDLVILSFLVHDCLLKLLVLCKYLLSSLRALDLGQFWLVCNVHS